MRKKLVVLLGPTAVGKTELSLQLAERLGCPIISADSRQLYRDMVVATAAPTREQLARVPHHFIGTLSLTDYYSAAQYEADALALIEQLFTRHDTLLLTGGSMMYIDAVCNGIDEIPTISDEVRRAVVTRYEEAGLDVLLEELLRLDPDFYEKVDRRNPKRVIHAVEICRMTGQPYSSLRTETKKERPFDIVKIGLTRPRAELYERINSRVDAMMRDGLEAEARKLYPYRHLNALNTVGYKEMFAYFDGTYDLPAAVEKIKRNTRVYARKQMTWFRRDDTIVWFTPDDRLKLFAYVEKRLHE
ncbi:MAG TPA: tRNA (adenosine(37)-N6)-dimethylallyltransferase MiaA [Candidatus Caccoplasma merdavium]|nr:tRNA (adenosine(37)-N6)-dimethylallyltransferase MiaA [Candidatus Caccoplasma merdavium]